MVNYTRFVSISLLFALFFLTTPHLALSRTGIPWYKADLEDALKETKKNQKIIMIDIFAEWCMPCRELDETVFSRDDVAQALIDVITIRVDGDTDKGMELIEKYNVTGFPTVLFLDPDGEEIDRISGYVSADEFILTVSEFQAGIGTLLALEKQLLQNPDNLDLRMECGERFALKGAKKKAVEHLSWVIEEDSENQKGYASRSHFALGKYLYLEGTKDYKLALEHLHTLRKTFPDSEEARKANPEIAKAYHGLGRAHQALSTLYKIIEEDPAEAASYNAFAWFCFRNGFRLDEGIRVAERGLQIDPNSDKLWDTLAELYHSKGNCQRASKAITQAIKLNPQEDYYRNQQVKMSCTQN